VSYRLTGTLLTICVLSVSGCARDMETPPSVSLLSHDDPRVRVSGIYESRDVPGADMDVRLIHLLVDEDLSVRTFASASLVRRTGQRFGYLPAAPLAERAASVRQWVQWSAAKYPGSAGRLDDLREWLKNFDMASPGHEESAESKGESADDEPPTCGDDFRDDAASEPGTKSATP
jgi:hypothetical protein